jgi:hypothetical protein
MEIIKHGEPEKINQYKIFKCEYCGCEFKANRNEYTYDPFTVFTERYYCNCPDCDNIVDYQYEESSN